MALGQGLYNTLVGDGYKAYAQMRNDTLTQLQALQNMQAQQSLSNEMAKAYAEYQLAMQQYLPNMQPYQSKPKLCMNDDALERLIKAQAVRRSNVAWLDKQIESVRVKL